MVNLLKKTFSTFIFSMSIVFSYVLFLIYYDSTTGLDFPTKYYSYISHFAFGNKLVVSDGQSFFYYFFISIFVKLNSSLIGPNNFNEIINQSIQFGNYLLVLIGFFGLFKLYRFLGFKFNQILIALSVLSFFPPLIYLRLTFKSEILAFTLLPWIIYYLNKAQKFELKRYEIVLFSFILSVLLTIKASITAMILIILFIWFHKFFFKNFLILLNVLIFSVIFLIINFNSSDLGFLTHLSDVTGRWQYRANINFFYNINLISLLKEPFFNVHSNSLLSIILLDTFSDYFKWFWNHKESTNYLSYGELNLTNNFYIYRYLREYIGIALTALFYLKLVISFKNKNEFNRFIYVIPFIGIFVLAVNALGFPSLNFDPLTGDTFKTHYYAFLISISFIHLILINKNIRKYSIVLLPLFIFLMGFPKTNLNQNNELLFSKISNSNICYLFFNQIDCKNQFVNTCGRSEVIYFEDRYLKVSNYFEYPKPFELKNKFGFEVSVRNRTECFNRLNEGYFFSY